MRNLYFILFSAFLVFVSCEWHLRSDDSNDGVGKIVIERYDCLERHFLTSGDIAAMQRMNTDYPLETRTLIEDVLRIGHVDEPGINMRFLTFFRDSTLQTLLSDVQEQYADMSDIERSLTDAFRRLNSMIPSLQPPRIYTQIGSLDQSVVVGDGLLGISLDKYLGSDHPVYLRYGYTPMQRAMMRREFIVPDCLGFFLLSLYPAPDGHSPDGHIAKIQHVVNEAMGHDMFTSAGVKAVEQYVKRNPDITAGELLTE